MQIPFPTSSETRHAQLRSQIRQRRHLRHQANLLPQREIPNSSNRAIPAVSSSPIGRSWLRCGFWPEHENQAAGKAPCDQDLSTINFKVQPVQVRCRTINLHCGLPLLIIPLRSARLIDCEGQRSDYSENPEKVTQRHVPNALDIEVHDFEG